MRLIIEVKNPTEELTTHMLFTLVVGYFACAQYDVLYLSLRGGVATAAIPFPVVIAREQSDRGNPFSCCHCEGAKRPRQSVGVMVGVYAAYFTHWDRHACARDDTEIKLSLRTTGAAIPFPVVIAREQSDRGNPPEKVRSIYSVDFHPPGSRLPR